MISASWNLSVIELALRFGCLILLLVKGAACGPNVSETQTAVEERACGGTANVIEWNRNMTIHLQLLRNRYTNCTSIQGNLEITHFPPEADVDFLKHIREITGYLLIANVSIPVLKLPNLRIVRGKRRIARNQVGRGGRYSYSVYIKDNPGLEELALGQLREISNGTVYLKGNPKLCHVRNTVNWNDLLQMSSMDFATNSDDEANISDCLPCHSGCSSGFCWGPGRDECQQLTKTPCAKHCGLNRCRGPEPSECCHPECAGGCVGPSAAECTACRSFTNNGTCVKKCPELTKFDEDQYMTIPNPDGKFVYGTLCVNECPSNFLSYGQYCTDTCPEDMEEKNGACVTCDGPCPKLCSGFQDDSPPGTITWISDTTLQQFENCVVVEGDLSILRQSFMNSVEDVVGNEVVGHGGVEPHQLEQLSSIRKITGYLRIDGGHDNMTDLSFLRNLETIEGRTLKNLESALIIKGNPHLRSLGLDSLRTIKDGVVKIEDNPQLCYAGQINWNKLLGKNSVVFVNNNRDKNECARAGEKCHAECTGDGCWGPQQNQCLSCANYMYESVCLSDCEEWNGSNSVLLYHAGNQTCQPCHEQCRDGCQGPGRSNCTACLNAKDGPDCVAVCPWSTYTSSTFTDSRLVCLPCNESCGAGCTGPGSFVGEGGCRFCAAVVRDGVTSVTQCLPETSPCPPRYFETYSYTDTAAPPSTYSLYMTGIRICAPCHPYCTKCLDSAVDNCTECTYFKVDGRCALTCPNTTHYIENGTSLCQPCNSECSTRGCNGPMSTQCVSCRSFRDYYDPESFNCTSQCPPERVYSTNSPPDPQIRLHSSERLCTKDDTDSATTTKHMIIGVVVTVVGAIVIVAIAVHFRIRRSKIKLETLVIQDKFAGIELAEPLEPTDNKPDTSKLRLIIEQELRRGELLGQGAFGIVYKGFWLPPNENLKIPVAIKVLKEGVGANATKEILDEAHVMASVNNPHLVSLLALCMTSQIMLITQLLPLGSLVEYVKKNMKSITSRTLLNWCSQIAKGMKYLEKRHMIHRDLAARNVLVERPNWVKVTDFGLARILDCHEDSVETSGGLMPIKWLAPECIDRGLYSHKTDVWAFGVTVWELLTYGQKPFENVHAKELYSLLQSGERLPQPFICTLDVYMLLLKCWSSDPDSRPCFGDLAEDFAKMTRDPGCYLVIPGDEHLRLPDYTVEDQQRFSGDMEDVGAEKFMLAEDYFNSRAARVDLQHRRNGPPVSPRYTPGPVALKGNRTDRLCHTAEPLPILANNNNYLVPGEGSPGTSYLDLRESLRGEDDGQAEEYEKKPQPERDDDKEVAAAEVLPQNVVRCKENSDSSSSSSSEEATQIVALGNKKSKDTERLNAGHFLQQINSSMSNVIRRRRLRCVLKNCPTAKPGPLLLLSEHRAICTIHTFIQQAGKRKTRYAE